MKEDSFMDLFTNLTHERLMIKLTGKHQNNTETLTYIKDKINDLTLKDLIKMDCPKSVN